MKNLINRLLICLFLIISAEGFSQDENVVECSIWWPSVDLSDFCSMQPGHFDMKGTVGICNMDSNSTFPYDERIYIRVYYAYSQEDAMEEFESEREAYEGVAGYSEIADLGDAAFAFIKMELGRLDNAIILVVKDGYNISFEINSNYANDANNCLDETTMVDFARTIVNSLE